MTGVRSLNCDFSRLTVTNLTHHDHIRILPQEVAQHMGKIAADVVLYRHLIKAFHLILHRILHRHDAFINGVDRVEKGVQRGGFARTGRPGDQHDAVRPPDDFSNGLLNLLGHAQSIQPLEHTVAGEQAQRNTLAIHRWHGGNTDINLLFLDTHIDAPILRHAFLGDVHAAHNLNSRNKR